MYSHILIPTDGSELSKMALYEGVALAKALGARVSAVTVTTPFHVFTRTPSMVTDQPIIETAQNRGCDAIHMASHGRRGISAILLGSETLKVLTHSAIPVIVCRRQRPATLFQESFAAS